jgi:hypothetical protein
VGLSVPVEVVRSLDKLLAHLAHKQHDRDC